MPTVVLNCKPASRSNDVRKFDGRSATDLRTALFLSLSARSQRWYAFVGRCSESVSFCDSRRNIGWSCHEHIEMMIGLDHLQERRRSRRDRQDIQFIGKETHCPIRFRWDQNGKRKPNVDRTSFLRLQLNFAVKVVQTDSFCIRSTLVSRFFISWKIVASCGWIEEVYWLGGI